LLEGLRHLIVLKTTTQPEALLPLTEADVAALRPLADLATVEELYGHFQVLSSAEQSLRSASHPFMILEMALVRMTRIGQVQSLQTLLDALQHLETGPSPSSAPLLPPESELRPQPVARPQPEARPQKKSDDPPARPAGAVLPAPPDFWEALQEYVTKRRPSVAAFLQSGRILVHDEQRLVIGFANSFSRTSLLERDNLATVREAVEAVGGRPLQVEMVALSSHSGDGIEATGGVTVQRAEALEEAQQQKREIIQAVLDIFDGTIIT
jgi:DNA polymerase III gamma/tau subunit